MSPRYEVLVLFLAFRTVASPAQLKPPTLNAWNAYIQAAESRLRNGAQRQPLWRDGEPGLRERIHDGEIVAFPAGGKSPRSVPDGLIHDWIGAMFIAKVSLKDVFAVVQDYDRYAVYYGPAILASKTLSRKDGLDSFRVRYIRKALLATVVLDAGYEARYSRIDDRRWYSVARGTSIREIQNYAEPDERALPAGQGSGYAWRTCGLLQFEAGDGGVYVEQEGMALSRTIPAAFRWFVEPFVERLARGLVTGWLGQTRQAAISIARRNDSAGSALTGLR